MSFTNDRMAIYSYSRQQAIDDGVLVDITEMAQEAGFRFPVAVTRTVWDAITPSPTDITQSISGRVWDMLWMLRLAAKGGKGKSEILFSFVVNDDGSERTVELKAICHPGDMMEPVITIMAPYED